MNKAENFLSIHEDKSVSFIENKSEFIGHAFYVETQEEAERKIMEIREKYKDATHNCFAYIIGMDKLTQRYSDDGEPSGTAGVPMLEVLRKKDITNCLVVATRYFGGILLGAGGLVRAYTKSVVLVLDEAKIVSKEKFYSLKISVDYIHWGKIEYILKNLKFEIINIEYLQTVNINLFVKKIEFKNLESLLINETSNNCLISIEYEIFKSVFID